MLDERVDRVALGGDVVGDGVEALGLRQRPTHDLLQDLERDVGLVASCIVALGSHAPEGRAEPCT